ncbi:MAG: glycine/sarcosine/betaine reductase selenoprotein B family protein [Thermaerobacterales bacterium]
MTEPADALPESFSAFKKSFSYGSRSDLNFKFLAGLSEEDAALFFQGLLWHLGDAFDDGQFERIIDHVADWQRRAYSGTPQWQYDEGPFAPFTKPLPTARLALLASSGHFVTGDDPEPFGVKNMTQAEAAARINDFLKIAPTLSAIPAATTRQDLRVRHGGYDIRGAEADANVAFPLDRLRELQVQGAIGELAANAYSFVGACAQTRLLKHAGPQWTAMLKEQQVDAALLVPV